MEDFGLPRQGKIFINSSLCPYYKMLWSKSKKLLTLGKINSFYISNGTIRIKISENSSLLSITHVDDFGKHFPDIDLSSSRSGQISIIFTFMLLLLRLTIVYSIVVFSYFFCFSCNNHFQFFFA